MSAHPDPDTAGLSPTGHRGPEPCLGVCWAQDADGGFDWTMPVGDALADRTGRFASGALSVFVDSCLGGVNHRMRPPRTWSVTTELRLDVLRGPAPGASSLGMQERFLGDDGETLLASGTVVDDLGTPLAHALVRTMIVPTPDGEELEVPLDPWPPVLLPGSLEDVLAMTVRRVDDTTAEVEVAPAARLANPLGALHGGVFAAAAETAGAALFDHERAVSSTSLDARYVRQISITGPVRLRARVLHSGRRWGIAEVVARDERERVCATALVTVYGRTG